MIISSSIQEARVGNRRAPVATHIAYQLLEKILSRDGFVNGDAAAVNNGDGKSTWDCNALWKEQARVDSAANFD